jgi:hypothetical protein
MKKAVRGSRFVLKEGGRREEGVGAGLVPPVSQACWSVRYAPTCQRAATPRGGWVLGETRTAIQAIIAEGGGVEAVPGVGTRSLLLPQGPPLRVLRSARRGIMVVGGRR